VKDNLLKKGVVCNPLCPICDQGVKTIEHIFLKCDWAKSVWFASHLLINLNNYSFSTFKELDHINDECYS
jgi:hypothetical protein